MSARLRSRRIAPLTLVALVAALVVAMPLAACGDDDEPGEQAQTDTGTTQRTDGERPRDDAEPRAIAEELKELQRDVAQTGRALVEGTEQERAAAERDVRAQARRARELAQRAERDVDPDAPGAADLREAARDTERGVEELRRFADERRREGLDRANAELEAAEERLRSFAQSLRDAAPEEDARRALDELRERVPDIPAP